MRGTGAAGVCEQDRPARDDTPAISADRVSDRRDVSSDCRALNLDRSSASHDLCWARFFASSSETVDRASLSAALARAASSANSLNNVRHSSDEAVNESSGSDDALASPFKTRAALLSTSASSQSGMPSALSSTTRWTVLPLCLMGDRWRFSFCEAPTRPALAFRKAPLVSANTLAWVCSCRAKRCTNFVFSPLTRSLSLLSRFASRFHSRAALAWSASLCCNLLCNSPRFRRDSSTSARNRRASCSARSFSPPHRSTSLWARFCSLFTRSMASSSFRVFSRKMRVVASLSDADAFLCNSALSLSRAQTSVSSFSMARS
mmetsp:Transcript_11345/g.33619  ORF Transcript_11345/g.33619 Transcript_11345/m.33619 type:complete len:319 (-) Transcript_11345:1773-2729(-)